MVIAPTLVLLFVVNVDVDVYVLYVVEIGVAFGVVVVAQMF